MVGPSTVIARASYGPPVNPCQSYGLFEYVERVNILRAACGDSHQAPPRPFLSERASCAALAPSPPRPRWSHHCSAGCAQRPSASARALQAPFGERLIHAAALVGARLRQAGLPFSGGGTSGTGIVRQAHVRGGLGMLQGYARGEQASTALVLLPQAWVILSIDSLIRPSGPYLLCSPCSPSCAWRWSHTCPPAPGDQP